MSVELSRAVLVGGEAEDKSSLANLANVISKGDYKIVDDVEIVTAGWAFEHPKRFKEMTTDQYAIGHSLGNVPICKAGAGYFIALNPIEKKSVVKLATASTKVVWHEIGTQSSKQLLGGVANFLRYPEEWIAPFLVKNFSTLEVMMQNPERFPKGRMLLPTDNDPFHFTSEDMIIEAKNNGILAEMLPGDHMLPFHNPEVVAHHIFELINGISVSNAESLGSSAST